MVDDKYNRSKANGGQHETLTTEGKMEQLEFPIDLDSFERDELQELSQVFADLDWYCQIKISAREYRLTGQVQEALEKEQLLEKIYKHLPEWAKW